MDLQYFADTPVIVVTNDGRVILGTLRGSDQNTNIILADSHERLFSADTGVQAIPLGLYIIRGDNIAMIGSLDPTRDEEIDWERCCVNPLQPIVHTNI